jgi:hypothetical protein
MRFVTYHIQIFLDIVFILHCRIHVEMIFRSAENQLPLLVLLPTSGFRGRFLGRPAFVLVCSVSTWETNQKCNAYASTGLASAAKIEAE